MSNRKPPAPQFSQHISEVCRMMDDAVRDYVWNRDEVNRMDKLTQDYLHSLELDNLSYQERAKTATGLRRCRQMRRAHKNTVEVLEPLVQYLDSERGRNLLNLLKEVLGKTRRVEERMEGRVYYPRVLEPKPNAAEKREEQA